MARLLDLPDELLCAIIDYLQTDSTSTTQDTLPFHRLGDVYEEVMWHNPPQRIKNPRSLLLASRRLNRLLKPTFYRDICVHDKFKNNRLHQLNRTLEKDPNLEKYFVPRLFPATKIRLSTRIDSFGSPMSRRSVF